MVTEIAVVPIATETLFKAACSLNETLTLTVPMGKVTFKPFSVETESFLNSCSRILSSSFSATEEVVPTNEEICLTRVEILLRGKLSFASPQTT